MSAHTFASRLAPVLALLAVMACSDSGGGPGETTSPHINAPPSANAGPDMSATVGEAVQLHGSGHDADGDHLTYSWTFSSRPPGSSATLSGATNASASFVPDKGGAYVARLTVSDGTASASDDCTITVNSPPTADAGPDQDVTVGDTVQLDGTGSADPEGSTLTFGWAFESRPPGSAASLQNPTSATPSFVPDIAGVYVVRLVVTDGSLQSAPNACTISAEDTGYTLADYLPMEVGTTWSYRVTFPANTSVPYAPAFDYPSGILGSSLTDGMGAWNAGTVTFDLSLAAAMDTASSTKTWDVATSDTGKKFYFYIALDSVRVSLNMTSTTAELRIIGVLQMSAPRWRVSRRIAYVRSEDLEQTTSVAVPAGTFEDCVRGDVMIYGDGHYVPSGQWPIEVYVAPGTGIVKAVGKDRSGTTLYTLELMQMR